MTTARHWTCTYLDDIVGVPLHHSPIRQFDYVVELPINIAKVASPTEEVMCLGININATTGILTTR